MARTLYLIGDLSDELLQEFIPKFVAMDRSGKPITIAMCSSGGPEAYGWALYDLFRQSRSDIMILGYGSVASMASLVFQAADWRVLLPNARFMIHDGALPDAGDLPIPQLIAMGAECKVMLDKYIEVLAERANLDVAVVRQMSTRETYLSAEDAVAMGFADEVLETA